MKSPLMGYAAELLGEIPAGITMCELGCKRFGEYKKYFESIGVKHTSIDLNGLGGALKLDLTKPLLLGQFDWVTNFGVTEHVEDQAAVWRNIHNLVLAGGRLISATPFPGGDDWPNHGRWYPPEKWYLEFCEINGYDIEKLYIEPRKSHRLVCLSAKKVSDCDFVMPETRIYEMQGRVKMGEYV